MNKNDQLYNAGLMLGRKQGAIPKYESLLNNEKFCAMSLNDVLSIVIDGYSDSVLKAPEELISCKNIKNMNMFFFGYIDGKRKNIRNKATEKYQKSVGLVAKSYKIHSDIAGKFADACKASGVSIGSTLEGLMQDFINHADSE